MLDRLIKSYFWFDGDQESPDTLIRPLCLPCHDTEFGYLGWFYEGPAGPWEYACGKCGTVILPAQPASSGT